MMGRRDTGGPSLLAEARDTEQNRDWTAIRDVQQVRRRTRTARSELLLKTLVITAASMGVLALAFVLWMRAGGGRTIGGYSSSWLRHPIVRTTGEGSR